MTRYASSETYLAAKSSVNLANGCLEWDGMINSSGYGTVDLRALRRRGIKFAHRLSYEIHSGTTIPKGLEIDHICYNRKCILYDHLRCVTRQENQKGRRHNPETANTPKGERAHFAKLSNDKVLAIRELRKAGEPLKSIAQKFSVSQGSISLIANRLTWRHI